VGEEFTYAIDCDMCEVETEVTVMHVDVRPQFCPMCGAEEPDIELIDE